MSTIAPPSRDWGDTVLVLPADVRVALHNVFTGARVEPQGEGDAAHLPVGTVLASFPVALLEAA